MKNTRTGQRTIRKLLKGAGSAILLATLFVLVFAGTLSGAFGIEENLQQNGIIESNVADAAVDISDNVLQTNQVNNVKYADDTSKWTAISSGNNGVTHAKTSGNTGNLLNTLWDDSSTNIGFTAVAINAYVNSENRTGYNFTSTMTITLQFSSLVQELTLSSNLYAATNRSNGSSSCDHNAQSSLQYYNPVSKSYVGMGTVTTGTFNDNKYHEKTDSIKDYVIDTSAWSSSNGLKTITLRLEGTFYCENATVHKSKKEWAAGVGNIKIEARSLSGAGTQASPFLLKNRKDFDIFRLFIEGGDAGQGVYFKVQPDTSNGQNGYIDMLSTAYTPGGYYDTASHGSFSGHLDGNNVQIRNLVISLDSSTARAGLIGSAGSGAEIKNVYIGSGSSVKSERSDAAGVVGYASGTVTIANCVNYATISSGHQNGGIIGNIAGSVTVSNCHNYGAVSGTYSIGGIVGYVQSSGAVIENCINDGAVSASGDNVGGIVGNMKAGTLKGSISNNGNVTSNRTASYGDVAYSIISSRSGDYSGGQGLAKINDDNKDSKYYSSPTNISFVLDVTSAKRINGFAITNGDDNNSTNANQQNRTVKGVYIWGSNSNDSGTSNTTGVAGAKPTTANWNLIYSTANLPNMGTANSTRYNFSFNNFTQYRYYWVYLESRGQGVQLSEFDLRSNDLQSSTGGIAGYFKGSTANGATLTSAGTVTSSGYNVGGIFGYLDSSINATFNVTSTGGDSISGLALVGGAFGFVGAGAVVNGTIVVNAAEIDKETGGNYCFGGAIGYNAGTIGASITVTSRVIVRSSGSINGYIGAFAGGIVGYNEGTISGTTEKTGGDVLDVSKAGIVGGLAGFNSGTLSGAFTTIITQPRDDSFKVIDGGENVGGAVGYNLGNLTGTYNINTLIRGTNYVGGFIGYNGKGGLEINGYTNNSQVSGNNYVGGIVGGTYATLTIKNSKNNATITGYGYVGGILGGCNDTSVAIIGCHNSGEVNVTGGNVGGILGYTNGNCKIDIKNCYNNGLVKSTGTAGNVGGIIGRAYTLSTDASAIKIFNCYNVGEISNANSDSAGGIVGYARSESAGVVVVKYCYNKAKISGETYIGGIVGSIYTGKYATIENCYTTVDGTNTITATGTNVTTIGAIIGGAFASPYSTSNFNVINSWGFYSDATVLGGHNTGMDRFGAYVLVEGFGKKVYPIIDDATETDWTKIIGKDITSFYIESGISVANGYYLALLKENRGEGASVAKSFATPNNIDTLTTTANPDGSTAFGIITYSANATVNANQRNIHIYEEKIEYTAPDTEYTGPNSEFDKQGKARKYIWNLQNSQTKLRNGYLATFVINNGDDVNVTAGGYTFNCKITAYGVSPEKIFGQILNEKGATIVARKLTVNFKLLYETLLIGNGNNIYRNDAFGLEQLTISRVLDYGSLGNVLTLNANNAMSGFSYSYQEEQVFTAVGTFSATNIGEYEYTITINSTNYEFEYPIGTFIKSMNWSYKIIPYDLASHYSQGKVWFGANTDMVVTNNALDYVNGFGYYPLNATATQTPQALIYQNENYKKENFVIYVQYSNGNYGVLDLSNEYTLSALASAGENHVSSQSVSATGVGNFENVVTKYYVVLDSDFGWTSSNNTESWGTQDNPYVISTQAQLMRLSQILNGDKAWNSINSNNQNVVLAPDTRSVATDKTYSGAYFVVTNNIHLDGTFKPIGNADIPFKATSFASNTNGTLVTISYFYNDTTIGYANRDYVGLFGNVEGTHFKDLLVWGGTYNGDTSYTGKQILGQNYVGGLVGKMVGGIVENCTFTSNVSGASIIGQNYVGGLIGYANGTQVLYDTSDANMRANDNLVNARVTGVNYVGGIIGQWIITSASQFNDGNANGLYFATTANNIVTSTGSYAGAIAGALDASGCADNLEIKARLNVVAKVAKKTTVNGVNYVGALYGSFIGGGRDKTTVTYNDNDVWATIQFGGSGRVAGGFIGYLQDATFKFNKNYNIDNNSIKFEASSGKTPSFFGGVVGVLGKGANIAGAALDENNKTFCTLTNSVDFGKDYKYGDFVGGIVGYVSSGAGRPNMGSTIFGDDLVFVGDGEIHATNYVGGIFGAIGIIDGYTIDDTLLLNTIRYGSTTDAPNANIVTFKPSSAKNVKGIYGTNNVGGLIGGVFKKALIYLENEQKDANVTTFEISNSANIEGNQYVGGIVGYLEQEAHVLNRVVNTGVIGATNASYVGGLVGYMIGGTISNSVSASKTALTSTTDLYLGSEYVGGLVGYMRGGALKNSVATGFKFEVVDNTSDTKSNNTSATKGGVVGDSLSANIEGSWTIYIATDPSYKTVSLNKNGKYVLIDSSVVSQVGAYEHVLAMAGVCVATSYSDYNFQQGELLIGVKYPTKTNFGDVSDTETQPKQLAFYDVSGSDSVMNTKTTAFASANGIVRMGVSMTGGDSYSVCKYNVLFSDISKFLDTSGDITSKEIEDARNNVAELANATNDQIITYLLNEKGRENAQQGYRAPSGASDNYRAEVTTALYDNGGNITRIIANIYFKDIIIGSVEGIVGNYDSGTLTPGDSEATALTISNLYEWNDFAWSIYTGQEDYSGKYVKLLTNITVDKKPTHTGTNNASYDFNSEITNHSYNEKNSDGSIDATGKVNAKSNLGYNMAGNIAMGAGAMSSVTFGGSVSAGKKSPSFKGTFDGNGYTITINYQESASRASVFPNAQNATFKNLTIDGYVKATGLSGGYNDTIRSMKDYNLLSSKTGNDPGADEGIFKISDGNTGTKYYSANKSMSFVAEFVAPLAISGFAITNGGDNEGNPTRTVKKVMIWGSNKDRGTAMNHEKTAGAVANTSDGWTLVYDNSDINIGNKNTETYNRVVSNTVAYKYYWVYLEASGGGVQLSEFGFLQGMGYDCAGFVGKPFGNLTFTNCKNKADINAYRNAAGILGFNDSGYTITLESCVNEGNITSLEGSFTLAGRSSQYSYDEGWGYAAYSYGTGGIIGSVKGNLEIQSCRNTGRIIGGHNVGGIIGCSDGISGTTATLIIDSCANSGYILANSGYWSADEGNRDSGGTSEYEGANSYGIRLNIFGYAGGLVGRTGEHSILKMYASYNSGEVTCLANMVGGLVGGVGYLYQKEATVNYVKTGGKSVIAYCYNTGKVNAGGTFPKHTKNLGIGGAVDQERENDGGTVVGGIAGIVGNILITDCYNVGDVTAYGITAYKRSWQLRAGGIVGHSEPQSGNAVEFNRCYNIGTIKSRHILNTMGLSWDTTKDLRYGASISGYCDNVDGSASRVSATNCYSIAYSVSIRVANQEKKIYEYRNKNFNSWKSDERRVNWLFASGIFGIGDAQEYCVKTGDLCTNYRDLTALMKSNSSINVPGTGWKTSNAYNDFNGTDTTFNLTASYASIDANLASFGTSKGSYPSGWIFVYGCLPQLAVFAVDTYNGLSMRSVNYGRNVYGTYQREIAGEEYSPFVIKDGIDLLGLQTLVDIGYSFEGKYVEFANGTNNLEETASKVINMPVDGTEYTSTRAYQYSEDGTNYSSGKSYHLFSRGAASDYINWKNANYRYTAGDTLTDGATFENQNFIAIGRNGENSVFKGHISGAQTGESVTEIANLRIVNKEVAGLFGYVQDAEVRSVGASGTVIAYANGADSNSRSVAGGIVAVAHGASIIDGCEAGSEAGSQNRLLEVYAYGTSKTYSDSDIENITTSAGGIVGLANTVRYRSDSDSYSYSEGTTAIISNNKVVNAYVRSAKNNIGGIVGLATGKYASENTAEDKNNKVEISSNPSNPSNTVTVKKADISALPADNCTLADVGTKIGGIIGYSDKYISIIVRECVVGTDDATDTVTIQGENSIGGIVGETPDAVNEIIGCKVLNSATIKRASNWGVVTNAGESGTAIGGIVGLTFNAEGTDPITTTFSRNIVFNGKIVIAVQTNYISASNRSNDGVVRNVGGIVGDMGSGARIATGSTIEVGGKIEITAAVDSTHSNRNIGGVAGRTKDVAFSGTFNVAPTVTANTAYQVGGFIGKNNGTVNILADNTNIQIGGNISSSHDVGGFIGYNSESGTLLIGADQYRAVNYNDGLSIRIVMSVSDADNEATINTLIKGDGNNVGGIVGNSELNGVVKIVKGTIINVGQVMGHDNVGGIIGINNGTLSTGGSVYDTTLEIVNEGKVNGNDFVGGVIGKLNIGQIAGRFINRGNVAGRDYVGGSIGYVAKEASILPTSAGKTEFINEAVATARQSDALVASDTTTADDSRFNVKGNNYVGGSIGLLLGSSLGNEYYKVEFRSLGTVNGNKYVGGSIGVLAGKTEYTDFISKGVMTGVGATTAVGGSVGFIGVPNPLVISTDENEKIVSADIKVTHTHFEANGTLTLNDTNGKPSDVGEYFWGGIGGAIGAIGNATDNLFDNSEDNRWTNNTYYASGNVTAKGFFHVGGIVGLIKADNITIENMLAYDTKVTGGKNVGGIVGATIGKKTVINSAFSISTNENGGIFTAPQGNAGGIIGLARVADSQNGYDAADDTDARTSYWVKGYTNAELAGSNVTNLKTTLGRYTLAYEVYTLDGKEVTVVFTKELIGTGTTTSEGGETGDEEVAIYPTPYAYYESVGTHTATNGKTYTINKEEITEDNGYILIEENLTWQAYFDMTFGIGKIKYQNDVGAWVEEKSSWKEYSTGTKQTGWYFVYANDQQGVNNQIGTISAEHTDSTADGYSDLWYWKRIANAYTMDERNAGYDDDSKANSPYANNPLSSEIVREITKGETADDDTVSTVPQNGTLYATATSADFITKASASGYYMYIASSGTVKPTAQHGTGADENKFFIRVEAGSKDKVAGNVAVYYRSIAMGSALTYNGYERYAPISLSNDITYDVSVSENNNDDNTDKKNLYFYNTVNKDATTPRIPNTYYTTVYVYYFDDNCKAYVVGGIDEGAWKINQRKLAFSATDVNGKVYGDENIETTITITNIALADIDDIVFTLTIEGLSNPITIDLKNGAEFEENQGVTFEVVNVIQTSEVKLKGNDTKYNLKNLSASDRETGKLTFNIKFKNAKNYKLSVGLKTTIPSKYYTLQNANKQINVEKKALTIKRISGKSAVVFDNQTHGISWEVDGFVYGENLSNIASLIPKIYADVDGDTKDYTTALTNNGEYANTITINTSSGGRASTLVVEVMKETNIINLTGAKLKGTYYLAFDKQEADDCNYKFTTANNKVSEKLIISDNMLTVEWGSETGHTYNKEVGLITAIVTAKDPIESLADFVKEYFVITGKVNINKFDVITDKEKVKITFETNSYNADTYSVTLKKSDKILEIDCNYTIKDKRDTKTYEITQRTLSFTYQMTSGRNSFEYNSYHQGLKSVTVSNICKDDSVQLGLGGDVTVAQSGKSNGATITVSNGSNETKGTIDVGSYSAHVTIGTNTVSKNYTLPSDCTYSWDITMKSLSISGLTAQDVTYDGQEHRPNPTLNGATNQGNGVYKFGQDTIEINYKSGNELSKQSFVNAAKYTISINTLQKVVAKHSSGADASKNYETTINGGSETTFEIKAREITLTWTNNALVYSGPSASLGQTIAKVTADSGSKEFMFVSSLITNAKFKGYAGNDTITFKIGGAQDNAGAGQMTASIDSVTGKNADNKTDSVKENYKIVGGSSCDYNIDKMKVSVKYSSGRIADKVYDATNVVKDLNGLTFAISSTNASTTFRPSVSDVYTVSAVYTSSNVGDWQLRLTYRFIGGANYEQEGEFNEEGELSETTSGAVGKITPATITVTLDRLRNGRATRTFAEDKNGEISVYYGGKDGAVNGEREANNAYKSATYRLGEGFTISGFPGDERDKSVRIVAKYVEVGTGRSDFNGYVNYIYESNGAYVRGTATSAYVVKNNLYKALEFSIEDVVKDSGKSANYRFHVVDSSSSKATISGDSDAQLGTNEKPVRVYDTADTANKNVGKQTLSIEITVKTYKIKYGNTTQSYANSDGSYNKEWSPVKAVDLPSGINVDVKNGWMTENGQPDGNPKIYKQYTVIRGRANSTELSASVTGVNGKQLNYNMTNQPVLTIGYFVETSDDTFEIGSLSSLLIASYYWWVSANSGDPEFNQVINTTVTWTTIVSDADYESGVFSKPTDAPEGVTSWDMYFEWLETNKGITVFLNETGDVGEKGTWGYYTTTTGAGDVKKYSSFKQIRDINGTFTQSDIEMLNGFFRVYDVNTNTYIDKEWGYGKDDAFINNFLKVGVGNVAVAIGSIFKSRDNGFTGTYDGGGYVIEYFNIMSFDGAENVGMFDVLGGNATVKNLHLRNFTINAGAGNVGGIAGKALAGENAIENVSWHGTISMSGSGNVGGLIGVLARSINKAIALGTINAKGGNIGGLIGSIEQGASVAISNAVSFVYVEATGNVGAITASSSGATIDNAFYLASSAWTRSSGTLAVSDGSLGTAKTYTQLMQGSVSGYSVSGSEYYRYAGTKLGGDFDMLDDFNYSEQTAENIQKMNARQSLRLKDIVDVYMLMYDVKETNVTVDSKTIKVYTISSSSWLVGVKHGVYGDEIEIGNRQQVALLRELRFASFVLTSDVVATATSGGVYAYGGAFFGKVKSANGASYTIDFGSGKCAFEALATGSDVPYKQNV